MKTLMIVVGTRPNFVKLAPVINAIKQDFNYRIVHTGQHYDKGMSDTFFNELDIPAPDVNFDVNNTFPVRSICKIMDKLELLCYKEKPDCIVVIGDVSSTLAAAVVASQMKIPLAHIESGERSFDRTMSEELNRITTDHLSDFLFCTNNMADTNLYNEGISIDRRFIVGNVMIDNLIRWQSEIRCSMNGKPFVMLTLHRAGNVDKRDTLKNILDAINTISVDINVKFPIHPRTERRIKEFGLESYLDNIEILKPMGYKEFLQHVYNAQLLLTDSGGAQIESAFLGTSCVTLRESTEHICTIQQGCNVLAGTKIHDILESFMLMINTVSTKIYDEYWDGQASNRINTILGDKL